MKHIRILAAAFTMFAAVGAAQAAPVVELPQDAPRVFIRTAEAGPKIEMPYRGGVAATVVAQAAVAKVEAPLAAASGCMVAVAGTTAGTR